MIQDLASASTHCLLWERRCPDLAAVAGPAILASSRVTGDRHGSQGMSGIAPGVLSHPSYIPYKVFDNYGTQYGTLLQLQHTRQKTEDRIYIHYHYAAWCSLLVGGE